MDAQQTPFATLQRLARQAARGDEESCDLCGAAIPGDHRHLLRLPARDVLCACRACVILFNHGAAGGGTRRLIPTRCVALTDFAMTDEQWDSLRIPVNMAFFSVNSTEGRVVALYPGPAGATESLLALDTWTDLEQRNPVLARLEPDVEALLINRVRAAREYFLVPIDECFRLVGLIRAYWRGLSGGREVWVEIERFFAGLRERAASGGAHA